MEIDYKRAMHIFNQIPDENKCMSCHPEYVQIDAQRDKTLQPTYFAYEEKECIYYHAFHVAPVPDTDFFDVQSPYGYGGPISTSTDPVFLERASKAYCQWCKDNRILAEFIRFHPLLQNQQYYHGEVLYDRKTVWIDLSQEELFKGYKSRTRNAIRKALKHGVTVEWCTGEEFFVHFPLLYNSLMRELKTSSFYFFSDEYYNAWKASDLAHYALCKWEGDIVAASIFFGDANIIEYHLSASNDLGRRVSATNLLLHNAAEYFKELGCSYLHLGGGTSAEEENPLFFFKSGFSEKSSLFHIGKTIYFPEIYDQLKKEWLETHGILSNRVLFYR